MVSNEGDLSSEVPVKQLSLMEMSAPLVTCDKVMKSQFLDIQRPVRHDSHIRAKQISSCSKSHSLYMTDHFLFEEGWEKMKLNESGRKKFKKADSL